MKSNLAEQTSHSWEPTEHWMTSWDGTQLFYRAWRPAVTSKKAVILFHRGHEHSGRWRTIVQELGLDDIWVFAWDARGHGQSPGERGYADSFGCLEKDVDVFVNFLSKQYAIPTANMVVMAQSVGSVLVSSWAHDYAPPIRALVLGVPALRIRLYVPFAIPLLRVWQQWQPISFVQSYVKAKMLTHDEAQAEQYRTDPLITRAIAVNILIGLHDASTRLMADAGAIRIPTLVLSAGADWVVSRSAQKVFFDRLGAPVKEMQTYDGFYHDIFHERDRHLPLAKARQFILSAFHEHRTHSSLVAADQQSYTRTEFDRLSNPLPFLSWQRAMFAILYLSMCTVGRLSKGIRIGWQTGFDSGESLNYVYTDKAQGITPLGKLLDRLYLNGVGWKGIRQRKIHIEKLLTDTIRIVHASRGDVRILDIASGPGRYLLDVVKKLSDIPVSALLRDRSAGGLEAGKQLAHEMNLTNVRYEQGDAFDRASLASLTPRPHIAIVSGLYELFPDNERILGSLRGLHDAIEDGGYLIYTNQPWHPQVELIARALINRDGKPWIMRRRTQEEMDELVRTVGFEKLSMEIDAYGIFTVSLAQKR